MKSILVKTTVTALSISLIMSNAFAFGSGGFAGHLNNTRQFSGRHLTRTSGSFENSGFKGNQHRFASTRKTSFSQQQRTSSVTNSGAQRFTRTNTTTQRYTPQTMSVNQPNFVNNSVSYRSNTTIRKNVGVNVNSTQNTRRNVVSNQPVLGPKKTQPIEVNQRRSPVVVHKTPVVTNPVRSPVVVHSGRSPVVVTGAQPWGVRSSSMIVRNPVIINNYPYHGYGGYYHGYGGYYNNYNGVNTFLAVALGVSLFANVAQLAAASNHTTNTVVYPAYYPVDTMSVAAPIPYAPTTFVPYTPVSHSSGTSSTSTESSQPVNVTINNTINTTTAPAATTSEPATTTVVTPNSSAQASVAEAPTTASDNSSITNVATPVTMDNSSPAQTSQQS
ncbi:MAG: hypothetical protein HKM04_04710 [Legionellales bacterium]|nr:hypothetical protein [Legionellales bacterium]